MFKMILMTGLVSFGALFVVYGKKILLTIHHKTSKQKYISITWFILFCGLSLWFGRSGHVEIARLDKSAYLQVGSVFLGVIFIFVKMFEGGHARNINSAILFLLIYSAISVLSSPLSVSPLLSAYKSSSLLVILFVAISSSRKQSLNSKNLVEISYVYFSILLLLAILGGLLIPDITHKQNNGVFGEMLMGWPVLNSNSLGAIAAIMSIVSIRRIFSNKEIATKIKYSLFLISTMSVLILAQSRTSIIGLISGLMILSILIPEMRKMKYIFMMLIAVSVLMLIVIGDYDSVLGTLSDYLHRGVNKIGIETLSGRTYVWKAGWEEFMRSPLIGHGFYTTDVIGIPAHNSYLTVLLNSGIIGFLFWIAFLIVSFITIIRNAVKSKDSFDAEVLAVSFVLLIRTITGSDLTVHHYSTMLFISILIYTVRKQAIR